MWGQQISTCMVKAPIAWQMYVRIMAIAYHQEIGLYIEERHGSIASKPILALLAPAKLQHSIHNCQQGIVGDCLCCWKGHPLHSPVHLSGSWEQDFFYDCPSHLAASPLVLAIAVPQGYHQLMRAS